MSKWSGVTAWWPLVSSNGCRTPETLRHQSCPLSAAGLPPASRLAVAPYLAHKLHIRTEAAAKVRFSYNLFSFTAIPTHTNTNYRIIQQIFSNYVFTHFIQNTSSDDATPWQHKQHFYCTKHRPTLHTLRALRGGILYVCILTYITHTYIHTHTHIHTCIHTYTHIHTHVHIHTHIHTHTYIHTCIHTYTRTHTYIHTHTHTYIHTYIHTHTHPHTYIHTYIHTYTHTHTYTHAYIHSHKHTYIHTQTHTYIICGCQLTLQEARWYQCIQSFNILISQHCKCMHVNFVYSRIWRFYIGESDRYLDWRIGFAFLCSRRLPEVSETRSSMILVTNCILRFLILLYFIECILWMIQWTHRTFSMD